MKGIFKYGFLVVLLSLNGCGPTIKSNWKKAESEDTIKSYEHFLDWTSRDELIKHEDMHWIAVQRINRRWYYREFIDIHKNSRYEKEARKRIQVFVARKDSIKEKKAYDWVIKSNRPWRLRDFLSDYPQSSRKNEIVHRISVLEQKKEEEIFQLAVNSGYYQNLHQYAQTYPDGRYISQIKEKLDSFSWTVLSSPQILLWVQLGIEKPLRYSGLRDLMKKSMGFQLKGVARGATLEKLSDITICEKEAGVEIWGKIPAPHVFVSATKSWGVVRFKMKEGYGLPQIGFDSVLPVGSILIIEEQNLQLARSIYYVRSGTIKIVSDGFELQTGTEMIKSEWE